LTRILRKEPKGPGGRLPFDYVMMFRILILQRLYNIGDTQAEYQIKDRLSFMRFPGPTLCDTVPDEKTIWEYREHLVEAKIIDELLNGFTQQLEEKKVITYSGSIIDATFVDVPRGRKNSKEENKTIKEAYHRNGRRRKTRTREGKKTWMGGGQRKTTKYITGIRTM
jgi:IS5 family transposase